MKDKHKLPFGQIEYRHLEELVDITEIINYSVFDDWFNFNYSLTLEEEIFFSSSNTEALEPILFQPI